MNDEETYGFPLGQADVIEINSKQIHCGCHNLQLNLEIPRTFRGSKYL